jgi:hypothetical protein
MNSTQLNEHDANQGAQSSGEFLGMTGNSGWYLLGSGGATIMMVILLWGVLGVSLLLCLFVGLVLCLGSVAYVFALKNNKPEHYDTDFFESALVESGVLAFRFGPRDRRPSNPFADAGDASPVAFDAKASKHADRSVSAGRARAGAKRVARPQGAEAASTAEKPAPARDKAKAEPVVARAEYEQLQEKLSTTEELLEDALAEAVED